MPKSYKFLIALSIIQTMIICLLIGLIVYFKLNCDFSNPYNNDALKSFGESTISTEEKVNLPFKVSATLVWWDQDGGFESIEDNYKYIDSITPFWYELDSTGKIVQFNGAGDEEVISFLKSKNISITPIISNEFETEPLSGILADDAKRASHIDDIEKITKEYDGISLNYENLNASDKDNFTNFVTELSTRLHADNKTLAVHLHAKTDKEGTWNGPQSQDWEALGEVCDKLKIMAYDYHWSTSEAGAIAPPDWVSDVVTNALNFIPKEKIYLGIPFYGYDWVDEEAEGLTFKNVEDLLNFHSKQFVVDEETGTPHFTYNFDNRLHEVWFENADSINLKIQIASENELGGMDFFRLGGEDPGIWEKLSEY